MYSAFLPIRLLCDYPYPLECLTCYENFLLVGTKQGMLLVYEITPKIINHPEFYIPKISVHDGIPRQISSNFDSISNDLSSRQTHSSPTSTPSFFMHVKVTRTFGKKPITQLSALPELDLLLALADGKMSVYQLKNCQLINSVPKSKGASLFVHCLLPAKKNKKSSINLSAQAEVESLAGSHSSIDTPNSEQNLRLNSKPDRYELRICVVVKLRLYFWRWSIKGAEFVSPGGPDDFITSSWITDLDLPDVVRSATFCGLAKLLVGCRGEYLCINLISGDFHPISSTGHNQLPLICSLPGCVRSVKVDEHRQLSQSGLISSEYTFDSSATIEGQLNLDESTVHRHNGLPPHGAQTILGIERNEYLTIVSPEHEFNPIFQIKWTHSPHNLHVYPPFIFGAMEKCLEIRVLDPNELIQQLPIARVTAMCHSNGWFYVATAPVQTSFADAFSSSPIQFSARQFLDEATGVTKLSSKLSTGNEVWLILSANRSNLIENLISKNHYELAMCFAKTSHFIGQAPIQTNRIAILHAIYLYQNRKFSNALELFHLQLINPLHVLSLFPSLLPADELIHIDYPCDITLFNSSQLDDAMEPLITYLLTWRRILKQTSLKSSRSFSMCQNSLSTIALNQIQANTEKSPECVSCYSIEDRSIETVAIDKLSQLVDTCLLKCYLATNTARVGPLLRQENACKLLDSVHALIQYDRYHDLIMLYQSRGLHRQALHILQQFGLSRIHFLGPNSHKDSLEFTRYSTTSLLTEFLPTTSSNSANFNDESQQIDALFNQKFNSKCIKLSVIRKLGHPKHMIEYFTHLGPIHLDLLIEYGHWILLRYPLKYFQILTKWEFNLFVSMQSKDTDSMKEECHKPGFRSNYRGRIFTYLRKNAPYLTVPYLELVIFTDWTTYDIDDDDDDDDDIEEDEDVGDNTCLGDSCTEESPTDISNSYVTKASDSQSSTLSESTAANSDMKQNDFIVGTERLSIADQPEVDSLPLLPSRSNYHKYVNNSLWPLPYYKLHKIEPSDPDLLPPIPQIATNSDQSELHTQYAISLIERAQALQPSEQPFALKIADQSPPDSPVARLRLRLLRFLRLPMANYSSDVLLEKCVLGSLLEESALLLAKLNEHEQAFILWVYLLENYDEAVNHCCKVYYNAKSALKSTGVSTLPNDISHSIINPMNYSNANCTQNSSYRPPSPAPSIFHNLKLPLAHSPITMMTITPPKPIDTVTRTMEASSLTPIQSTDLALSDENAYKAGDHAAEDIFFTLVQLCLQPPTDLTVYGLPAKFQKRSTDDGRQFTSGDEFQFTPKIDKAIQLLQQFSAHIDAVSVLNIFPDISLGFIAAYLKKTLVHQGRRLSSLAFSYNASKAELIASRSHCIKTKNTMFTVVFNTRCHTCRRRIGNSAFVRHPTTGDLEHYGCCQALHMHSK